MIVNFRLVIDTLKETEKDRKCFRMIGGVLVEKTVGEVLPILETSLEQVRLGKLEGGGGEGGLKFLGYIYVKKRKRRD